MDKWTCIGNAFKRGNKVIQLYFASFDDDDDDDFYEPYDYDSDIGSATVDEMRIQNELH